MQILATILFALALAAGCTAVAQVPSAPAQASISPAPSEWLGFTPAEVVEQVSKSHPRPVATWFHFVVEGIGTERSRVFLNSEKDYRDPLCLTIVLDEEQTLQLLAKLGLPEIGELIGQHIAVLAIAHRVKVDFYTDGLKTDKYYYQTHASFIGEPRVRILTSQELDLLNAKREG